MKKVPPEGSSSVQSCFEGRVLASALLLQFLHFLLYAKKKIRRADGERIADEEDGVDRGAVRLLFDVQQIEALESGEICESGLGKTAFDTQFFDCFGKCVR